MTTLTRGRMALTVIGALAVTLTSGGIALAQPGDTARTPDGTRSGSRSVASQSRQPMVTADQAREAAAAMTTDSKADATDDALATDDAMRRSAGTVATAVVTSSGALVRGNDAAYAHKYGPGQYEVVFHHDVSKGTFTATIGLDTAFIAPPGEVSTAPRAYGLENAVFVQTYDSDGNPADLPFHLAVFII